MHFKLTAANVEQNNVKGARRFFLLRFKEVGWNENANELVIPFVPASHRSGKGILRHQEPDITADRHSNSEGESVTFLEHHLRQYTRARKSDFFIHKDLKGFLSGELNFYLKNEVLNFDEMEVAGEEHSEGWFQVMRVIKAVGSRIIDFLDQIASFQKMLWEKRKFVRRCAGRPL